MSSESTNKKKIINDPVYGFIKIPYEFVFDLTEHPYLQRLRRIKQLGLTNFVYPGATHTRFQHAIGSSHLMGLAIDVLRTKGHGITEEEAEAAIIAILLHDIGHGPFSHALEDNIIQGINHEELSLLFMHDLNRQFEGKLDLAIRIFTDQYHKRFLHQLVASQLDMDRLDYLKRDSFFTGVTEGVIGSDRIVRMLNVLDDKLVVDSKGIYSIEKFLIARRLMFWQVYLHKAVLSAEILLVNILKRAKELASRKVSLFCTPPLEFFLYQNINRSHFFDSNTENGETIYLEPNHELLIRFAQLDDNDIMASAKVWAEHQDPVLSVLCNNLINRKLFRIVIQKDAFSPEQENEILNLVAKSYQLNKDDAKYFVQTGALSNYAYSSIDDKIQILYHNGELKDVAEASDMLDLSVLSKTVQKHYVYYPKDIKAIN